MDIFSKITKVVACDRGNRKVPLLSRPVFWKKACGLLVASKRIALVTGFMIQKTGTPETDGPCGAAVLGRSLLRSGRKCRIFTDPLCSAAVSACSAAVGGPFVGSTADPNQVERWSPDLVVFIERPGRSAAGRYYNMKGEDITDSVFPLDDILAADTVKAFATIAVGDGGNEAGMGTLAGGLAEAIPSFFEYTSSTRADVVLPSDVSNWGAYALALLLSSVSGRWLGHSAAEERRMLEALVGCGAVDGVSKKSTLSVDGFSLPEETEVLLALRGIYEEHVSETSPAGDTRSFSGLPVENPAFS